MTLWIYLNKERNRAELPPCLEVRPQLMSSGSAAEHSIEGFLILVATARAQQQTNRRRRQMKIKEVIQFAAMLIGALAFVFVLWASIWIGCAMVDSCYYANMAGY